jgi:hypothetical protein
MNEKVEQYIHELKTNICNLVRNTESKDDIIRYIEDYPILHIDKEDMIRKKRMKNVVPQYDRCMACVSNQKQCTRRKKKDGDFCGTHDKGTPHGTFKTIKQKPDNNPFKKVDIFIKDIKGIHYYIDNDNNVYMTDDILNNKLNPRIIANYIVDDNENYSIPDFE